MGCVTLSGQSVTQAHTRRRGQPDDVQAMVLVGEEDVAARIDQDVLGLGDQGLGQQPAALGGIVRQIPGDLAREVGVADVVDPQPGVEPRHEHQVVVGEQLGPLGMVLVVRSEAPTTRAEVRVRRARGGLGDRQQRHQPRVALIADVDDAREVVRLLLPFRDRFGVDQQQVSRRNGDHGVQCDHAGERGADVQSGDEFRSLDVRDVEDHEPGGSVAQVGAITKDVRRSVQRDAPRWGWRPRRRTARAGTTSPPPRDARDLRCRGSRRCCLRTRDAPPSHGDSDRP